MSLGLRVRLFAASAIVTMIAAFAADASMTSILGGAWRASDQAALLGAARLAASRVSEARLPVVAAGPAIGPAGDAADVAERTDWNALAAALGHAADARVTIGLNDGTLLADTLASEGRSTTDDGSLRAVDARADPSTATGARSAAGGERFSYAVAPFDGPGGGGIVRLSRSTATIDAAMSRMRQVLWTGAAVLFLLAILAAGALSEGLRRAIAELTAAARRMSEGDLKARARLGGRDALAELGHTIDRWAAGLERTLGDLRAERDLQKRILEAMHDGVVVVDRHGRVVLVNPALRSMLLLGADAVGRLLIETVRHAQLTAMLERAREQPEDRPVEIDLPGLKPRRVLVQVSPLSGGDEGMLFVFVDVTELRRLESLRRDFVANASHELRTPIAAVRSANETLRTGALEDPVAATRFIDMIERNAQRLQSLVEDMLELSKLESNEFKLKREPVELQRVVPIVLALFRERADKKGVRLIADVPPALPAIDGDARALEHVLLNLVDNAVKYCPSGTRILVGASEEGERIRMVVSDTGPGIAAEHLGRVFERFYRIDAGRSRELGGTGLGLSIVKHMVEAMRGKVSVESSVGKGSTFAVLLHRAELASLT